MSERLICEAYMSAKGRVDPPLSPHYHLRPTQKSGLTLCEMQVCNGTYIPLVSWGHVEPDGPSWCPRCTTRGQALLALAREEDLQKSAFVGEAPCP